MSFCLDQGGTEVKVLKSQLKTRRKVESNQQALVHPGKLAYRKHYRGTAEAPQSLSYL